MKTLLTVALCWLVWNVQAQNTTNINVFSEKGERFWVTINGIKQNAKASQHVKITGLQGNFWKMRVIFENQNIPEESQNVGTTPGYENHEFTYQVKQNRKGEYVIRAFSVAPIAQSTSKAEITNPYSPTERTVDVNPNINVQVKEEDKTGFTLKVDEKGLDLRVNVPNDRTDVVVTTPTDNPYPNTTTTTTNNNNSSNNCWSPMNANEFAQAKKMVQNESFEETKMNMSKQFTRRNCLSIDQIKQIVNLFTFEENKFEYVKFAYDFCQDKRNYYQLSDVFTFSATKDDFNEFLEGK
jgi:nuclear transport factor 2 (NTF2) superfamily protein